LSVCQEVPKKALSPFGLSTRMISGCSSMPFAIGCTSGVPSRRANASCASRESFWSRSTTTPASTIAARSAARVVSSSASETSTPAISAPSAPAIGRTSIRPCMPGLPSARRRAARAG
jgi:hypothetical protein